LRLRRGRSVLVLLRGHEAGRHDAHRRGQHEPKEAAPHSAGRMAPLDHRWPRFRGKGGLPGDRILSVSGRPSAVPTRARHGPTSLGPPLRPRAPPRPARGDGYSRGARMTEVAGARLLRLVRGEFSVRRGHPLPLGASARREGVNFSVFTRQATEVRLVLFLSREPEPVLELPLEPRYNRTGDVWHALVTGLDPGAEYAYRMDRTPNPEPRIHRFAPQAALVDPYGKGVAGLEGWGRCGGKSRFGRLERVRS